MMRRRTNAKGDPNRNTQLKDGGVQFEPASIGPLGHSMCFSTVALSAFVGRDPAHAGMVQLSINERGPGRSSSGNAWLTRDELAEYIAHLTEIHASLSTEPT